MFCLYVLVNQTLRKVKYRSECSVLDEFQTSTEFDMNLQYHLDNQFYFVYFVYLSEKKKSNELTSAGNGPGFSSTSIQASNIIIL